MNEQDIQRLEAIPIFGSTWAWFAALHLSALDAMNLENMRDVQVKPTPIQHARSATVNQDTPEPRRQAA